MSVHVFCGPSCSPDDVTAILPHAVVHGPAGHGDVYRVALQQPRVIALIDGYFEHRLAVWHKELLWALHRSIRVYGASSMGALRALELGPFGMVGVGRVHALFASGKLEADDEVALCHLGPEHGYRAQSVALVNIRITLAAAAAERVITRRAHVLLTVAAQALFYPDRDYARVIANARAAGMAQRDATALRRWLGKPARGIDQKHADALELLQRVREDLALPPPAAPDWDFPHTEAWHVFSERIAGGGALAVVASPAIERPVRRRRRVDRQN